MLSGSCPSIHQRVQKAQSRADLYATEAERLKGMPGKLIEEYQRNLRFYGVDNMSSTGGVLSSAHTAQDVEEATAAFAQTVDSLLAQRLILAL